MTCIAGLVADGGVYLAGDSAYGNQGWREQLKWPKVWTTVLGPPFTVLFVPAGPGSG